MKRNGSVHYKCHVSVCLLELIPKCENSNNFQTRNGSNGLAPFCLNLQKKITSCILVCGRTRFVLYISSCVPRHLRIRPRLTSETAIQKTGKRARDTRRTEIGATGVIWRRFPALISRLRVVDFSAARFRVIDWTYNTTSVYSACIGCNLLFTSFCPVGVVDCSRIE